MRRLTIREKWNTLDRASRLALLFGVEGILLQYVSSIIAFGNALYATNMGASDTHIGLIQTIPNLTAIVLMLACGALSERVRSPKTLPTVLALFMGFMYIGFGSVPLFGAYRMVAFFVFLALTSGVLATYNAQWQSFFGETVEPRARNDVYAYRNRFMFFIGTFAPLLCGAAMVSYTGAEEKIGVLRLFYYSCAIALFLMAAVLWRVPSAKKPKGEKPARITPAMFARAGKQMWSSKDFRSFFFGIMLFYLTWHIDWSTWYVGQIQYIHLSEWQLSVCNALGSVAQLVSIGFWARRNERKGIESTFTFGVAGLLCSVVAMLSSQFVPLGARQWYFIAIQTLACGLQGCISICLVQMLLRAAPKENNALIISLYTIIITLSNSILPLLGVQIYTWLGANQRAFFLFYGSIGVLRIGVTLYFAAKAKRMPKPVSEEM